MHWYQYTKTQIEQELQTNIERGLSQEEAKARFLKWGPNLLPETPPESFLSIFFRQFKSPLIYILVVCAVIVYFLGDEADSLIILVVLVFNAVIGSIQEGRSQNTLRSLRKLSEAEAVVLRDGEEEIVPEREVVVGDILVLQEGQKLVADARVIHSSSLSCDEAALTGESGAVIKSEGALLEANLPAAAQKNMVFKGTSILAGNGLAVVVATGLNTEIGKISKAIMTLGDTEIPLQKNIRRLSRLIIYAVTLIASALFVLGLWSGRDAKEMFAVVVSLAVSMIPEGLPLVLTLILVTGVFRMSKRNALVKKLQAVEALGQAKVIAVDKTGTLTKNEMAIKKLFLDGKVYSVTGTGYTPVGHLELGGVKCELDDDLALSAKLASLASRATVKFIEKQGVFKVAGDPTEAAMQVFGEKLGFSREMLFKDFKETAEIPFDYRTKFRAVFYEHQNKIFCAIAGAPEVLIARAEKYLAKAEHKIFSQEVRQAFETAVEEFSQSGLRVVAFGFKVLPHTKSGLDTGITDIVLGGLYGIEDMPRPEAALAIRQAQNAGLKVVMITGDHRHTARVIAKEAGIFREGDEIITGSALAEMTPEDLATRLSKVSVFARVTPEDKMKIIQAYKRAGLIIAMTGDGVNDAPSLVAADLGVGMGKIGTEVAKEAADIVLLDDNLSSIVAAIEEGRAMYKKIQKSLLFLFSTSLGELLTITAALFLRLPMPILAVQILWLNLVTDPLIGTALALSRKESGLLERGVEKLPKYFISRTMLLQMFLVAVVMSAGTLYLFNLYAPTDYGKGITVALTTLAVFQWYNGFNCQFPESSVFSRAVFWNPFLWLAIGGNATLQMLAVYNPFMQKTLKTTPLSGAEWEVILIVPLLVILAEEIRKLIYRILSLKDT